MSVTYITELRIGRNINGTPMDEIQWVTFIHKAACLLGQYGEEGSTIENHRGTGSWENEDGTVETEDSAVVTLYGTTPLDSFLRTTLKRDVAWLAEDYGQQAIAVVYGESVLVSAAVKGSTVR